MLLRNELAQRAIKADDDERLKRFGPSPSNPFATLRQSKNLTLSNLAAYSRVDRKALSRLEDGLYTNPLPNVVDYWVRLGHATEGQLLEGYADFQYLQRRRHHLFFGRDLIIDPYDPRHPFRQLRARRYSLVDPKINLPVGILDAARALCVPVDTIQFFEKRWRTQQSVPKGLKAALNQCGYMTGDITIFEGQYKNWRKHHLMEYKVMVHD